MFDINQLLTNLRLEQLDDLLFRGQSLPLPLPKVYGGQVLAQAMSAASRTVGSDRIAHSMHAYFLRPGDGERPIIYDVDPIRDGNSFTTRRVVAKQGGKAIFNCAVSFQIPEPGVDHQMDMPEGIPDPESLPSTFHRVIQLAPSEPGGQQPFELPLEVVDIRRPEEGGAFVPVVAEPIQGYWFRFSGELDDQLSTHQTLLTYMTDKELMLTGLRVHGLSMLTPGIQLASLDHALWFHHPFRVDDWLYYHMDSPRSGHARHFSRGSIYTRQGVLVASCAQEGLVRL